jgi:hypothetical protein
MPTMYTIETLPQQAEHFEWLNAIDFFHNYLDIINERIVDLSNRGNDELDRDKVDNFSGQLVVLRNQLYELSYQVSEHLDEMDMVPVDDNRLELDLQKLLHYGIREKFDGFEEEVNELRTAFNEFYVKNLDYYY